ncbi:MAG: hypothetical protein PWQ72_448 [Pseudothermotoga sp.]|nr:hypothetical protein [Pseudothermotoga sp.]
MKKTLIVLLVLFFFSSCMIRPIYVPPRVYSISSAVKSLQDSYLLVFVEEVDGYGPVEAKGVVASYVHDGKNYLFYGFKFYDESPKVYWKKIVKEIGIWSSRTYFDLLNSGLYSSKKDGKYIVVWWKDVWMFIVESSSNAEDFANYAMNWFAKLGGSEGW